MGYEPRIGPGSLAYCFVTAVAFGVLGHLRGDPNGIVVAFAVCAVLCAVLFVPHLQRCVRRRRYDRALRAEAKAKWPMPCAIPFPDDNSYISRLARSGLDALFLREMMDCDIQLPADVGGTADQPSGAR